MVLCISCRYADDGNGKSTNVPFRSTRRTPPTSPTLVPSTDSQSIVGWGLPEAEQSNQPPDELENSNLDGGSITNEGPRRCASNAYNRSKINGKKREKQNSLVIW